LAFEESIQELNDGLPLCGGKLLCRIEGSDRNIQQGVNERRERGSKAAKH
jgi:hypothetical protein